MRAAKLVVLLAGVLGVVGFFLPLASFTHRGAEVGVSAFQVFTGVTELEDRGMSAADLGSARAGEVAATLSEIRGAVVLCFLPGGLLAMLGLVGVARRRFGRLGGALAILLGGVSLLIFSGLNRGVEALHGEATRGAGMYLVLGAGILGVIGGVAAMASPDRGAATS
jgi:hypothetical protein